MSVLLIALVLGLPLMLGGCAYRLPALSPPSQELIRIVAKDPKVYTVQVDVGRVSEYKVPDDGLLKVVIPPYRMPCGVYVLNVVKVGGYGNPLKIWSVSIERNSKAVRKLSLQAVRELELDQAGYHLLTMKE